MVVVEAAARGAPSVVVAGPDNAAAELVEEGVNGVVAASAEPQELADAIVRVHEAGRGLRASTADGSRETASGSRSTSSLDTVLEVYGRG